jgi:hypothetical protein
MFDVSVTTKALPCDVELICGKPEFQEAQDRYYCTQDRLGNIFEASRVNDLREIAQPVAKVDLLTLQLGESMVRDEAGRQVLQDLAYVTVSPDISFELAADGHLARAEGRCLRDKD